MSKLTKKEYQVLAFIVKNMSHNYMFSVSSNDIQLAIDTHRNTINYCIRGLIKLMPPTGFEPATFPYQR